MGKSFMNLIMYKSQVCVLYIQYVYLCMPVHCPVNHLCAAVSKDLVNRWVSLRSPCVIVTAIAATHPSQM